MFSGVWPGKFLDSPFVAGQPTPPQRTPLKDKGLVRP